MQRKVIALTVDYFTAERGLSSWANQLIKHSTSWSGRSLEEGAHVQPGKPVRRFLLIETVPQGGGSELDE